LGVGVDLDEAAAELIALADADQPGVVFRLAEAGLQQLLEHDGDLDPVGRGQRIQLQRMLATRQLTLVGGPGNGPVDAGKLAAVVLVPGPDPWWYVAVFAHLILPVCARSGIDRQHSWEAWYPRPPAQATGRGTDQPACSSPSSRHTRLFTGRIQASPACSGGSARSPCLLSSACTAFSLLSVRSSRRTVAPTTETSSICACSASSRRSPSTSISWGRT